MKQALKATTTTASAQVFGAARVIFVREEGCPLHHFFIPVEGMTSFMAEGVATQAE
ncbi:hypothetical protein ACFY30_11930 [Streptomyces sp. NPDC000345]|uniref:hypothetical protein n=1 Tax=Streptomyces sp. NPDC000345 TaxID=3364537 RepID=UPI00367EB57D